MKFSKSIKAGSHSKANQSMLRAMVGTSKLKTSVALLTKSSIEMAKVNKKDLDEEEEEANVDRSGSYNFKELAETNDS